MVLGVGGQRVATSVDSNGSTSRYGVVKLDIGRLRLIELHVPIAIGLYLLGQFLAQRNLAKGGAVGWKTARWESASSYIGDAERKRISEQVLGEGQNIDKDGLVVISH